MSCGPLQSAAAPTASAPVSPPAFSLLLQRGAPLRPRIPQLQNQQQLLLQRILLMLLLLLQRATGPCRKPSSEKQSP